MSHHSDDEMIHFSIAGIKEKRQAMKLRPEHQMKYIFSTLKANNFLPEDEVGSLLLESTGQILSDNTTSQALGLKTGKANKVFVRYLKGQQQSLTIIL